ncbi:MAG: hypothetical protein ACK4N5_13450 [Myxococcales bacterium]
MARLHFLPQETLDGWSEQGKVDIQGDRLVEIASQAKFAIREAVRFVKLESGEDTNGLLKKVKSLDQMKALGAEHYMTSVIIGDSVYEVVPGWIAEDPTPVAASATAAPAEAPRAPSKKFDGGSQEADLLAKLLLDKLS